MSQDNWHQNDVRDAVRQFIVSTLLERDDYTLGDDERLLSAGLITSLDLVSIAVFVERRFQVALPEACVWRERLDSVRQIAELVAASERDGSELTSHAAIADHPDPLALVLPSFRRAPVATALALMLGMATMELAARFIWTMPELQNLLPPRDHRRLEFDSSENYERALAAHAIGRELRSPDELRVVFIGDSGTYGVYLTADEACPAVLGRVLAQKDSGVRVFNLSSAGQSLVKDAELLEAVQPYRPDLIVLSVSSASLEASSDHAGGGTRSPAVITNRILFTHFLSSLNGREHPELMALSSQLADAERSQEARGLVRALVQRSVLVSSRPAIRKALRMGLERWLPTALRQQTTAVEASAPGISSDATVPRIYKGKTPSDVRCDEAFAFDSRFVVLLESVVDRARAAGSEIALFVEPEPTLKGSPARRIPWNEAGWQVIAEAFLGVADRKRALLVDARDLLPQEEFLDTNHHWSIAGNRAIGELLARRLSPVIERLRQERQRR